METRKSVVALSRSETRSAPEKWGADSLTQFLVALEEQAHASFAGFSEWFDVLTRVDASLVERAPEYFHEIDSPRQTSAKLFMRSFSTYRAAVRLVASGQLFEATVLMRSILESAVYAWVCAESQEHREAWEKRGDGDEARKKSRRLFGWKDILGMLFEKNPELGSRVSKEYDDAIDLGAHPNVEGLSLSSDITQISKGKFEVSTIFFHGPEAVQLGILNLVQCMHAVTNLLGMTIKHRLRILGSDEKFNETDRLVLDLIRKMEAELADQKSS